MKDLIKLTENENTAQRDWLLMQADEVVRSSREFIDDLIESKLYNDEIVARTRENLAQMRKSMAEINEGKLGRFT